MAKMGGIRSPKGQRQPSMKLGAAAPQKPGMVMPSTPPGGMGAGMGMSGVPNAGFAKGGVAKKKSKGKKK